MGQGLRIEGGKCYEIPFRMRAIERAGGRNGSLVPQRIDRIESGGAAGRHEAEEYTDAGGENEGDDIDLWVEKEWRADLFGSKRTKAVGESDSGHATDAGKRNRLDQELEQHLPRPGADGEADADFPGAFGDGDEHDVHDADAADKQTNRRHPAEQRGHYLGAGTDHLGELLRIEDIEVVLLVSGDLTALTHQRGDVRHDVGGWIALLARDHHLIEIPSALTARETVDDGGVGSDHVVIEIVAEAALSLRAGDANNLERQAFHPDLAADRIDTRAKEFLADGFPDDADRCGFEHLGLREKPTGSDLPVRDGEVIGRGALDVKRAVPILVDYGRVAGNKGGHRRDAGNLVADRIHILHAKLRSSAATPALAGTQDEQVVAHL